MGRNLLFLRPIPERNHNQSTKSSGFVNLKSGFVKIIFFFELLAGNDEKGVLGR
jgi:hypothetical protein